MQEARRHITEIAVRRDFDVEIAVATLDGVIGMIETVDRSIYEEYEAIARERMDRRDPNDWPVVATALLLEAPVWTEDQDFFGSGVATWTTDRIELYLRDS